MTIDFPVIDPHHHLARLRLGYPWLAADSPTDRYHGDDRALRRDYLPSDYRADIGSVPVAASIHIENGAGDPLAEARWIGEVIEEHSPLPAAHVARADLRSPTAPADLEALAAMPHVRGIRQILNWHPDRRFTHVDRAHLTMDPSWRDGFARLHRLGLSFDLQVFADQLPEAARLAAEHTDTRIVLDHIGMPIARDAGYLSMWRAGMSAVAANPNVTVKISAIGTTDHHWSVESIRPLVESTIDTFGPTRVMFASNFPVDGLYSSFGALYTSFDTLTAGFSRGERQEMFAGTASRFYRVDFPGDPS